MEKVEQNKVWELTFKAAQEYEEPLNRVELNVIITDESGNKYRVPSFWAGKNLWKVRFSSMQPGEYSYSTECSVTEDKGLHKVQGKFHVVEYTGENALYKHGPLKINHNRRYLVHADGTPFLWLGDTWWDAMTNKLSWPDDFKWLVSDRKNKGFNVVQFKIGFNSREEASEEDIDQLDMEHFNQVDMKLQYLADQGIVACLLGVWSTFLIDVETEKLKNYYNYLVARYSAYPIVWAVCGELLKGGREVERMKRDWSDIIRSMRQLNPMNRIFTIHPRYLSGSRDLIEDETIIDFDMLQGNHNGYSQYKEYISLLFRAVKKEPPMPVVNGEVCYEGIFGKNWEDTQRFLWWTHMICGGAGFSYGANGLWGFMPKYKHRIMDEPYKDSFGGDYWKTAARYLGSRQLGMAKKLLEGFDWHLCRFRPDWISRPATEEEFMRPYCMGIPEKLRIIYLPEPVASWNHPFVLQMESGIRYKAICFNPRTGKKANLGIAEGDAENKWRIPSLPVMQDMVIVLKKINAQRNKEA